MNEREVELQERAGMLDDVPGVDNAQALEQAPAILDGESWAAWQRWLTACAAKARMGRALKGAK